MKRMNGAIGCIIVAALFSQQNAAAEGVAAQSAGRPSSNEKETAMIVGVHGWHKNGSPNPWSGVVRVDESTGGNCKAKQDHIDLFFLARYDLHARRRERRPGEIARQALEVLYLREEQLPDVDRKSGVPPGEEILQKLLR